MRLKGLGVQLVALALLALGLLACASPTASGATSTSPTPSPTTTALPAIPPSPTLAPPTAAPQTSGPPIVTLAADGGSITMHVGDRFLLALGQDYDWKVVSDDPSVVGPVENVSTVQGSQGLYQAHKPGQTKLSAVGVPTCRRAQTPCSAPSRAFHVEVVVEP